MLCVPCVCSCPHVSRTPQSAEDGDRAAACVQVGQSAGKRRSLSSKGPPTCRGPPQPRGDGDGDAGGHAGSPRPLPPRRALLRTPGVAESQPLPGTALSGSPLPVSSQERLSVSSVAILVHASLSLPCGDLSSLIPKPDLFFLTSLAGGHQFH